MFEKLRVKILDTRIETLVRKFEAIQEVVVRKKMFEG